MLRSTQDQFQHLNYPVTTMPTNLLDPFLIKACQALQQHAISAQHVIILNACMAENLPSMSEISKLVGLTTAAITGTVDRMSRDGLVERLPDPDGDRRSYRLGLTERGLAKIRTLNATFDTL